jgi:protein TonB
MRNNLTTLDLEEYNLSHPTPSTGEVHGRPKPKSPNRPVPVHFEDALVENFHLKRPRSAWDVLISALGHGLVVALIILLPLCYTHAIDLPQLEKTFLVAPPPPPPPPPAVAHVIHSIPKSFFSQGKLFAPKFIPKQIAQIKEQAPTAAPSFPGLMGGVPGGVPGGQLGGVLGGILGGYRQIAPPPPPKPQAHSGPYRVGGRVQAPLLIHQVQPGYPILAKEARIQGNVQIDSVIDEHGNVTQMKVVSGHPLLVQAAFNAVQQWKYQPPLLNGTPISVEMIVTVQFILGN